MISKGYKNHIIDCCISHESNPIISDDGTCTWHYTGIHRVKVKASSCWQLASGSEDLIRDFILDLVEKDNNKFETEREKWSDWNSFYWSKGILWGSQTGFAPAIVKDFPLVKIKLVDFRVVSIARSDYSTTTEAEGILSEYHDLDFPDLTPKSTTNQDNEDDYEYED